MRRIYTGLGVIVLFVIGCQKDKGTPDTATNTSIQQTSPPPSAYFKINNVVTPGNVWEAQILKFENSSQNGETYYWDFGNGITSTEKIPSNISLAPCGFTYTVTLTVKNKDGVSSTYSSDFFVFCSRGMGFGAHKE